MNNFNEWSAIHILGWQKVKDNYITPDGLSIDNWDPETSIEDISIIIDALEKMKKIKIYMNNLNTGMYLCTVFDKSNRMLIYELGKDELNLYKKTIKKLIKS